MDLSWLGEVESPIAAFVIIVAIFIGSLVWLANKYTGHNTTLVKMSMERSDNQNEKLIEVVEKNTSAYTEQSVLMKSQTIAMHRVADEVGKCQKREGD